MTEDDPLAFMRGEVLVEKAADGAATSSFGILVTLEAGPEAVRAKRAKEELMGKALELNGELGGRVAACVVGTGAAEEAKQFVHYGLDGLFALPATHGCLTKDLPGALAAWAKTQKPDVWLFSDSPLGRRLAARVAMRLETGLVASVTDFDFLFAGLHDGHHIGNFGFVAAQLNNERRPLFRFGYFLRRIHPLQTQRFTYPKSCLTAPACIARAAYDQGMYRTQFVHGRFKHTRDQEMIARVLLGLDHDALIQPERHRFPERRYLASAPQQEPN